MVERKFTIIEEYPKIIQIPATNKEIKYGKHICPKTILTRDFKRCQIDIINFDVISTDLYSGLTRLSKVIPGPGDQVDNQAGHPVIYQRLNPDASI